MDYVQGSVKYDGNKLTGTAPNVFVGGADINTASGIYLNLSYNYTNEIPLNDANSFYASHYNIFYGKAGFQKSIGKKFSLDLNVAVDHSFNKPFSLGNDLNAAGNRFFNPSSPENIYAGLKLKLLL